MAEAARVGEPTLVDPKPTSATQVAQEAVRALATSDVGQGSGTVSVEQLKPGATPPPSQPIPRSDAADTTPAPAAGSNVPSAGDNGGGSGSSAASPTPAGNAASPAASTDSNSGGIEDLTSATSGTTQGSGTAAQPAGTSAPAGNNQPAQSNDGLTAPAQAPAQINDAASNSAQQAKTQNTQSSSDQGSSSSNKKKKKKHKLVPF
jgi:outer membrane protein assembly factor BamD